jgi:hypothetical protein
MLSARSSTTVRPSWRLAASASAEIVLGKGPKPAGDTETFDARAVIENLGPRIQRPEDGRVKPKNAG